MSQRWSGHRRRTRSGHPCVARCCPRRWCASVCFAVGSAALVPRALRARSWSSGGFLSEQCDALVERGGRDESAAADFDGAELVGADEVVDGPPADAEPGGGLVDGEEGYVHGWSPPGGGFGGFGRPGRVAAACSGLRGGGPRPAEGQGAGGGGGVSG